MPQQSSSRKLIVDAALPPLPFDRTTSREIRQPRLSLPAFESGPSLQAFEKKTKSDTPKAATLHVGFRKDYKLGEKVRSSSHYHDDDGFDSLKTYDFAWVRRKDRSWTYAILASRSDHDSSDEDEDEDYMLFVLDDKGSSKCIKRRHWKELIRCVRVEDKGRCNESSAKNADLVPRHISFGQTSDDFSVVTLDSCFNHAW
jgi:hypothetical protein